MSFARNLIAAVLAAGAVVEFFFWGGEGLGFTIFFLAMISAYYIACGFPTGSRRYTIEHILLLGGAGALAFTYVIFANESLRYIDGLALFVLLGVLFLHGTIGNTISWDRVFFALEVALGYIARPFVRLAAPWKAIAAMRKIPRDAAATTHKRKILLQILLGVLVAVPLVVILFALLAASDPIFANIFQPLADFVAQLRISDIVGKIIVFLVLLPFVLSSIWSLSEKFRLVTDAAGEGEKKRQLPPVFITTVFAFVNLLYILYAAVQFVYLFSAWKGQLPDGLTYATYARNGFFELAFISLINALLLLLGIRLTTRTGALGMTIRVLSMLLLLLSGVQLISAFLRMNLYIEAYGMSILRFFVTAFMILLSLLFVFLAIREFAPRFPLFRATFFAALLSLLLLNYISPDYWIAKYNTDHYLDGSLTQYDVDYIGYSLSGDGIRVMLDARDRLTEKNPALAPQIDDVCDSLRTDLQSRRPDAYKDYSLSRQLLKDALAEEK